MTATQTDFTPAIDLLRQKGTGPARTQHPDWVSLLPPCNAACPAGEDIQAWLDLAQAGRYREAWEVILRDNPFPAVHGRVCYHPCETGCNRAQLDSAVSIHAIERFLGDMATAQGWVPRVAAAASGKRVLVIGAGPSGMSAAYHLARAGHEVEIRDAGALPGGMLHFGIPAYRLPREVLMREVRRIEAMGVVFTPNHTVVDVLAEQAEGRFDAVFVAIGTQIGKRIDIPARDATKVFTAIGVLHDAATGTAPKLGRRVAVYGAGNTAMDAARSARRLGAEEAMIVFISDRAHMEAHPFEAEEALDEGISIHWLSSIHDIGAGAITVERMVLDADGRAQPTGEFETLAADSVVLALGQKADSGFLKGIAGLEIGLDGNVLVDGAMMTGHAGIFAGGDLVPGERSVTQATGGGRRAARNIDAWLRRVALARPAERRGVSFDMLHLPIYAEAPLAHQHELDVAERMGSGFVETTAGLSEMTARHEAQRCLSCGNCFSCDQCFAACPEQAILKLGTGYDVDLDHCTGCGVCFEQCPCHAIEMVQESRA